MAQHSNASQTLSAYIIDTIDPHNNEYIPDHWKGREWLSGFTGSAGVLIVTQDEAALWTDSRYWLQAAEQLAGSPITLMCDGKEGVPSPEAWVKERILRDMEAGKPGPVVGFPKDMANGCALSVCDCLHAEGLLDQVVAEDALGDIWPSRPALPKGEIYVQDEAYTGMGVREKLDLIRADIRHELADKLSDDDLPLCHHIIFSNLSNIAWTLNLRGCDIAFNPVFLAYLAYHTADDSFTLYTHGETLTPEAKARLDEAGVAVEPYDAVMQLCREGLLGMPSDSFNYLFSNEDVCIFTIDNPITPKRQIKCDAECEGFRSAMLQDGVAMVQFLRWLDERTPGERLTECSVAQHLEALRSARPGYMGLSFETIAAYAAHGAIVHYEPTPETDVELLSEGLLLLDSGAQFAGGTTDITRTIALGEPTDEERKVYTLVLKGHLALACMHFPQGTTGLQLDTAARAALWQYGYDFGHGTGHGVGSHLCVHEGDYQIRKDSGRACVLKPFKPGMTVTDEPGVYLEGRFGVRIENVLLCVPDRTTECGDFLRFETLTLCPYDLRAVDFSLLDDGEIEQINSYHRMVRERLMPLLDNAADREWLHAHTEPVSRH